jgi:hypothetical protein
MDPADGRGRVKDGLITIGAIWLALVVAGLAVSGLEISLVATLLSFGIYTGLLACYAFFTGPGGRSAGHWFLVGGLLYPVACIAALIALARRLLPPAPVPDWVSVPMAGLRVGWQPTRLAHEMIGFDLLQLAMSLLGPILLVLLARSIVRHRAPN